MQTADIPPNQTLYVQNLNEKISVDGARPALCARTRTGHTRTRARHVLS